MDAPLFGGEVEYPNTASGSVPAPAFESSAPAPTAASAPTPRTDDACAWSNTWRDDVAAETARTSPRNNGVGGMPTDADGASHPTGTPVSSRTGVLTDPLRSLPGDPAAMLAALHTEDDTALRAGGPHALAEQLLALQRLRDMLEAEQLRRITAFDTINGAHAVRCRSTKGFLRAHAQLTGASPDDSLPAPPNWTPSRPSAPPRPPEPSAPTRPPSSPATSPRSPTPTSAPAPRNSSSPTPPPCT